MFDCHNCKAKTPKLIIKDDVLGCPNCLSGEKGSPAYLHMRGWNKHAPKMSWMDRQHLMSRRLGEDGKVHATGKYK